MVPRKNVLALEFNHIEAQVFSRYLNADNRLNYLGNYRIASGLWNNRYPHDVVFINISPDNYRNCVSFLRNYPRTNHCQLFFTANTYFDQLTQLVQTNANAQIMMKPLRWEYLYSNITASKANAIHPPLDAPSLNTNYLPLIQEFDQCTDTGLSPWIKKSGKIIIPDPEMDCSDALGRSKAFATFFISTITRDLDAPVVTRLSEHYNNLLLNLKSISRTKSLLRLLEQFLRACYNTIHPSYISIDEERIADIKKRIAHYIENDVDFSLESIAQEMYISTSYLSRMFNKIENLNYKDYILNLRLAKACHLLTTTNQTVEEIALHCGYRESSSFSRAFKSRHLLSPMNYRKQQTQKYSDPSNT